MKNYKQHKYFFEKVCNQVENLGSSFSMECAETFDNYEIVAKDMLASIKELEKKTRKTDIWVYKNRMPYQDNHCIAHEDFVKVGYLDVDGELVFNEITSELLNPDDRFSRTFYIKQSRDFVPFYPKSKVLEVVHSLERPGKDEFCVIGFIENDKIIYYDQIVE